MQIYLERAGVRPDVGASRRDYIFFKFNPLFKIGKLKSSSHCPGTAALLKRVFHGLP